MAHPNKPADDSGTTPESHVEDADSRGRRLPGETDGGWRDRLRNKIDRGTGSDRKY